MTPANRESTRTVVASVFARSPRRARVLCGIGIAYFVGMLVWLVVAQGERAFTTPYLWGGFCGGASGMLIGWTSSLYSLAQDGEWSSRWRWRLAPSRMNEMLLALPTLSMGAAILATASVAALLPAVFENGWFLLVIVSPAIIVVYAVRIVAEGTRFLYRTATEQAAAAEHARAEASDARLAALQAQMNPHFLFNALNTIASLVRTDPRAAEATTENLAAILRTTLDRSRSARSTVGDEADYLGAYLAIERERFGERLCVEWRVEDAARGLAIPPMTLQPLVENALKHGIGGRIAGGTVRVGARRSGEVLRLWVEDDGNGFARGHREGTGLGNLRARLETQYGSAASLDVEALAPGSRVTVTLPAIG